MAAPVPLALTPFIGRDSELEALVGLVATTRLVTLTGAGGSGKTRLAAEVARHAQAQFADGAGWVELAPLADPELLPTYLLDALGIEPGPRPPMQALLDTLRERRQLLVLDNCEHLVAACAAIAESLLRGCPRLHILATSREALGVAGERAWLVPGLAVPQTTESAEQIADAAAVRLFVDRAQSAVATFRLTPGNAAAVAQICRRLDGLPLAIELAAARVRALPPHELAARLDDTFRVLTAGSRTAVPRHRTLREAIDWSYNLLAEREKLLLQRLSMFAGDFTLAAAESVGGDVDLDVADVLDVIDALVDKSLVVMREAEGTARFYLLETIRQYARARLKESGGFHRVCARHARAYMDLVADAAPHFITRERPRWVRLVHRELDNIRIALACTRDDDVAAHLTLVGNLGWFWYSSGLWAEARRWLEGALALPWTDEMRHARARVLLGAGVIGSLQGDPPAAIPWLEESAALFREVGDRSGESYALAYQGVSHGQTADPRTVEPATCALEWFRGAGDLYGLRLSLVVLSTYYALTGDIARARETGEEAVRVAREFGLDRELAIALQVFAAVNLAIDDFQGAAALVRESVLALQRDPSLFWSARALQLTAVVNFGLGKVQEAARLMGTAEVVRETIGAAMFGPDRRFLVPALEKGRAAIGDTAFEAAWKSGRDVPLAVALDQISAQWAGTAATVVPASHPMTPATPAGEPAATEERTTGPSDPLEVRALGPVEILRDGVALPAEAWRYARPRELLLYLLAHREGRTREQIGLVFWPDASAMQVKNNFHVTLHHLRKALGRADLIAFENDRYRIAWELGVRFDAQLFEDEVKQGLAAMRTRGGDTVGALDRLRRAFTLYRGDFLADAEAGDWHLEIRDRLRHLYCDAMLLAADRALQEGQPLQAAELFRRAVELDELHEKAHRGLMLALARAGDRSEALRQYDRLSRTLRSDLEAEPDRETKALYERLRKAETV